jgi:hypothetical protein
VRTTPAIIAKTAAVAALGLGILAAQSVNANADTTHAGTAVQQVTVTGAAGRTLATADTARASVLAPAVESSIVCGGTKYGSGWFTLSYGGYVGQGCGAGTDHVETPTNSYSIYDFGTSNAAPLAYQAWIPVNAAADALMDFTLYACGIEVSDTTVDEAPNGQWVDLFDPLNKKDITEVSYWEIASGCDVQIKAWTGQATSGLYMGLDAIRTVS